MQIWSEILYTWQIVLKTSKRCFASKGPVNVFPDSDEIRWE